MKCSASLQGLNRERENVMPCYVLDWMYGLVELVLLPY